MLGEERGFASEEGTVEEGCDDPFSLAQGPHCFTHLIDVGRTTHPSRPSATLPIRVSHPHPAMTHTDLPADNSKGGNSAARSLAWPCAPFPRVHAAVPSPRGLDAGCAGARAFGAHWFQAWDFCSSDVPPPSPPIMSLVAPDPSQNFNHILRLLNTNVDGKIKIMYALTKIGGVGRRYANIVCKKADVDLAKR